MGLFYILVAEHEQQQQLLPAAAGKPGLCFSFPVSCELSVSESLTF
jgi:hypothetical protein